jgi:hypothetical protein
METIEESSPLNPGQKDASTEEDPSSNSPQEWWTTEREEMWSRLDEATQSVIASYDSDEPLRGRLKLHASGPNPLGINADITPDSWYVSLPYDEAQVDVEAIAGLLSDELETSIKVQPRYDNWEPGYWFIVDDTDVLKSVGQNQGEN